MRYLIIAALAAACALLEGCWTPAGICKAEQEGHYYVAYAQGSLFSKIVEYKVDEKGEFELVRQVK